MSCCAENRLKPGLGSLMPSTPAAVNVIAAMISAAIPIFVLTVPLLSGGSECYGYRRDCGTCIFQADGINVESVFCGCVDHYLALKVRWNIDEFVEKPRYLRSGNQLKSSSADFSIRGIDCDNDELLRSTSVVCNRYAELRSAALV